MSVSFVQFTYKKLTFIYMFSALLPFSLSFHHRHPSSTETKAAEHLIEELATVGLYCSLDVVSMPSS